MSADRGKTIGEDVLTDQFGVEIFFRRWKVETPRALVLISHGASEHSGRYDRFACALNEAGFAAAAVDHRGHGRTAAATGAGLLGPGGGEAVVEDLHELRSAAESDVGSVVPTFVFGHSMGALIALAYLTRHSEGLVGAVLCGFPADLENTADVAALLAQAVEGGMRDQPFDALAQYDASPERRTPFDWLSRDEAEVDRYIADPMCGDDNPLTYGYVADLFSVATQAGEGLGSITCPILVIAGDQDPAGDLGAHPTALAKALSGAGVATDLRLYPGARHELLNETNRDEVTGDVVRWLAARLG